VRARAHVCMCVRVCGCMCAHVHAWVYVCLLHLQQSLSFIPYYVHMYASLKVLYSRTVILE